MKILIFGSTIESKDIEMKLARILGNNASSNEYINTYDIEEFPKLILSDNPDIVIVTANGQYGKDCVDIAKEINRNIPLFWFSNDMSYSAIAETLECTFFAKKPVFSKVLVNAMKIVGAEKSIGSSLSRTPYLRMVS